MSKQLNAKRTLHNQFMDRRPPRKNVLHRAAIADRFKTLCRMAGMKVPDVARELQVTERTVYAWFSGRTAVPYSAYRLLRILNRFELPAPGWEGWQLHSGKLWTPEGYGIAPHEGAWWSLLVRQARGFNVLMGQVQAQRAARSESALAGAGCAAGEHGQAPVAPAVPRAARPNLFQSHIPTEDVGMVGFEGRRHA